MTASTPAATPTAPTASTAPGTARPRTTYHPRPRRGWLNDPNGMTYVDGRWHVFFQHNPHAARHGHIHWGHLSSADLVSWTEHPVAFGPTPGGPDSYGCWTGVAIPGSDPVAVVYSGVVDETHRSTVCRREALDERLDTWSEPVVVADTPDDIGLHVMRDPYLFDVAGRTFALLGAGMADGTPCVLLYSCDDPLAWRYERVWLRGGEPATADVPASQIWECPQIVAVDDAYVVVMSLVRDDRLTDVCFLVGDLTLGADGLPAWVTRSAGLLDDGGHCYAPQVVPDLAAADTGHDAGALLFGWVLQDNAPEDDHEAVAGCLTLPRRLRLDGDAVVVTVDEGLQRAAIAAPTRQLPLRPGDGPVALPEHGVTRVTRRGDGPLVLAYGEHELALAAGDVDVWTDADVAEVYRPGAISTTLRHPGAARWTLTGDADVELVDLPAAAG